MNKLTSTFSLAAIFIGLSWVVGCSQNEKEIKVITFETTLGPIVIELFEEEAQMLLYYNQALLHEISHMPCIPI